MVRFSLKFVFAAAEVVERKQLILQLVGRCAGCVDEIGNGLQIFQRIVETRNDRRAR